MTIVLTGGGSGGHITPLLVVAAELKRQNPDVKIIYVGQKGDHFADLPKEDPNISAVYKVRAGKFRRYNGEGLKQILDISTLFKNVRDMVFISIGLVQGYFLIKKLKPDLIFSRGGYVSVPVCLGAKLNGVGYITHDSDPIPSLTNRIIGPGAKLNLVAQPKDIYPYKKDKTVTTGIPISRLFVRVTEKVRVAYRQKLNVDQKAKMIFVIGGGLGARSINEAFYDILPNMMSEFKDLRVVHIVGRINEEQTLEAYKEVLSGEQAQHIEVLSFTDKVYMYSGAADLVITRAGATNLAEFETQGVACIVIPSTSLVGGHQLKNADILKDNHAAVVIRDEELKENPHSLAKQISLLLRDPRKRQQLGDELTKFAHPNAGEEIATLIIKTAEGK
ncbi:MAG: UDP-N-acetylglucosamine--N-acetylmuramyl-(pentapeptide) pyrophosphoryl-undecaprenol N-acetylglucosamine transferase [Candidatus Saccharibacteria bacterium]